MWFKFDNRAYNLNAATAIVHHGDYIAVYWPSAVPTLSRRGIEVEDSHLSENDGVLMIWKTSPYFVRVEKFFENLEKV